MVNEGMETKEGLDVKEGWGWQTLVKAARQRLVDNGWPIPKKPVIDPSTLELPEDVESINSIALANLGLRLQSWYSYTTSELAFASAELSAAVEFFEIKLGDRMHVTSGNLEKKEVKEVLRSLAIAQSPDLKQFVVIKTQLDQRVQDIGGLVKSLDIRCRAIQNEQIRRATEKKVAGG